MQHNIVSKAKSHLLLLVVFEADNPLAELGNINIHVPSNKYNFIEMAHHIILVSIVDIFAEKLFK